jgi:transcriptional regulator with XRE-family HTH domain
VNNQGRRVIYDRSGDEMTGAEPASVQKRRLRSALRRWRKTSGLTQKEAADLMGWSLSKLVRLETGVGKPIPGDMVALFSSYGAPVAEISAYADMAREAQRDSNGARARAETVLQPAYTRFLEAEEAAQVERHWHPTLIPGILQTPQYSRAVLSALWKRDPDYIGHILAVREERQELISSAHGPQFHFILDEAVFVHPVGPPNLMEDQIEKLFDLQQSGRIKLQLVPMNTPLHAGVRGSFVLLDFEDEDQDEAVYIETPRGDYFSRDDSHLVSEYREIFADLETLAVADDSMFDVIGSAVLKAAR